MRILFVELRKYDRTKIDHAFFRQLLDRLRDRHECGIVSPRSRKAEFFCKTFAGVRDVTFHEWDIILVQDLVSFKKTRNYANRSGVPIVFVTHRDHWEYQPFLTPCLAGIFASYPLRMPGFPEECIHLLPPVSIDLDKRSATRIRDFKQTDPQVVFIHSYSDKNLSVMRSVIRYVNHHPSLTLTVIAHRSLHVFIKKEINGNIRVYNEDEFSETDLKSFDVCIASEENALAAGSLFIPVIIAGKTGLGGLLTVDNFDLFKQYAFSGRPGGEVGEVIPYWALHDEIDLHLKHRERLTANALKVGERINRECGMKNITQIFELEFLALLRVRQHLAEENLNFLRPVFSKSFEMLPIGETEAYHLISTAGKVIGRIAEKEKNILAKCTGDNSIFEIIRETEVDTHELINFMKQLVKEHIIYYKMETFEESHPLSC